jgi:hypothetical protein
VHGPDAAVGGRPRAIGDFVVDVRGGHHGPVAASVVVLIQPPCDPPLASFELFSYLGIHSKTSVVRGNGLRLHPLNPGKRREFSSFLFTNPSEPFGVRLAKD